MSIINPTHFVSRWQCGHFEVVDRNGSRVNPAILAHPNVIWQMVQPRSGCPRCVGGIFDTGLGLRDPPAGAMDREFTTIQAAQHTAIAAALADADPHRHTVAAPVDFMAAINHKIQAQANVDLIKSGGFSGPRPPHHRENEPCPDGNPYCHFHASAPCHQNPDNCYQAYRAQKSSFFNNHRWNGAPVGWNEQHVECVRDKDDPTINRCPLHQAFYNELWRGRQ